MAEKLPFKFSDNSIVQAYCEAINSMYHDHSYTVALEKFADWLIKEGAKKLVDKDKGFDPLVSELSSQLPLPALKRISKALDAVQEILLYGVHEDIIDYLSEPLEKILKLNGVNLEDKDI